MYRLLTVASTSLAVHNTFSHSSGLTFAHLFEADEEDEYTVTVLEERVDNLCSCTSLQEHLERLTRSDYKCDEPSLLNQSLNESLR